MTLENNIIQFPIHRTRQPIENIISDSLKNDTFYKPGEVDEPSLDKEDMTYGELKMKVALINLQTSGTIPDDLLFLIASNKELENSFFNQVENHYGPKSLQYNGLKTTFKLIHSKNY